MQLTEMPPPYAPAPKAKTKGKVGQKRARSPEKVAVKTTKIPESFSFQTSDSDNHLPANKKIALNKLTPEKVAMTKISVAEKSAHAESQSGIKLTEPLKETTDARDDLEKHLPAAGKNVIKSNEQSPTEPKKPKKMKGNLESEESSSSENSSSSKTKAQTKREKPKKKVQNGQGKQESSGEGRLLDVFSPEQQQPDAAVVKTQAEEKLQSEKPKDEPKKAECLPSEQKMVEHKQLETKVNTNGEEGLNNIFEDSMVAVAEDGGFDSAPMETEEKEDKKETKPVTDKPVALDATYVFETPTQTVEANIQTNSPELFQHTPKPRAADQTIVISKKDSVKDESVVVVDIRKTPEPGDNLLGSNVGEPGIVTTSSSETPGKVSSLVTFFDKNRKDGTSTVSAIGKNTRRSGNEIQSPLADVVEGAASTTNEALNSTYVLPPAKKDKPSSSIMNVTVCVKKAAGPEVLEVKSLESAKTNVLKSIVPPSSLLQQGSRFSCDSPASRTFVKGKA